MIEWILRLLSWFVIEVIVASIGYGVLYCLTFGRLRVAHGNERRRFWSIAWRDAGAIVVPAGAPLAAGFLSLLIAFVVARVLLS
jgi:hypothetical protein